MLTALLRNMWFVKVFCTRTPSTRNRVVGNTVYPRFSNMRFWEIRRRYFAEGNIIPIRFYRDNTEISRHLNHIEMSDLLENAIQQIFINNQIYGEIHRIEIDTYDTLMPLSDFIAAEATGIEGQFDEITMQTLTIQIQLPITRRSIMVSLTK